MTKKELINAIASTTSLSKVDASLALDAMTDTITNTLKKAIAYNSWVLALLYLEIAQHAQVEIHKQVPQSKFPLQK